VRLRLLVIVGVLGCMLGASALVGCGGTSQPADGAVVIATGTLGHFNNHAVKIEPVSRVVVPH
jgi:hypothetical protein